MKIASRYNIPFLATGNGHSGTVTSKGLNGVQIDLRKFKSVQYDAATSTVTVGGAVRFGEVTPILFANGKEIRKDSMTLTYRNRAN